MAFDAFAEAEAGASTERNSLFGFEQPRAATNDGIGEMINAMAFDAFAEAEAGASTERNSLFGFEHRAQRPTTGSSK